MAREGNGGGGGAAELLAPRDSVERTKTVSQRRLGRRGSEGVAVAAAVHGGAL